METKELKPKYVYVTDELWNKFKALAASRGMKLYELLEEALIEKLEREEK